jgi:hypothetical protein
MAERAGSSSSGGGQTMHTFTLEELLGGTNLKVRDWYLIDPELWYNEVEAPDDSVDATAAATYIARAIADYTEGRSGDDELFAEFCQDFKGWTEAMFERCPATYTKELKRIIRFKGVYTGPLNMTPSKAMVQLLSNEDPPQWPDDQFWRASFDTRTTAYRLQQRPMQDQHPVRLSGTPRTPRLATIRLPQRPSTQHAEQAADVIDSVESTQQHVESTRQYAEPTQQQVEPTQQRRQQRQVYNGRQPSEWYDSPQHHRGTPSYPQPPRTSIPPLPRSLTDDPYTAVPPPPFTNGKVEPTTITTFVKIWDRDKKYSGKPYDLLDDKLKIFYSVCFHADIQPDQFHAVFPRILTGRAEDYYIHFVDQQVDTFSVVYAKMKAHFDTDVNHSHYYTDWTTTKFHKVRRENADKTLPEVLEIMLDKLQLCQRALGYQYQGEYALRTTVITACRGVKELEFALFKPPISCEELFSDLRSSIENSLANPADVNLTDTGDDQYYLDRRYNNTGRGRGSYLNTSGSSSRRGGSSTRGAYQRSAIGFQDKRPATGFRDKKCFVCQKTGCWSTNHTLEERKQAKSQYLSVCEFNGHEPEFAAYLAAYEGAETDQSSMQSLSTATDEEELAVQWLTDAAFLHHVTGEDVYHRVPQVPSSMFLIEDRYTRQLYQGILPDSGAANMSTVGKEQFLALQSKDPTVIMDQSTAGNAQIKFG